MAAAVPALICMLTLVFLVVMVKNGTRRGGDGANLDGAAVDGNGIGYELSDY